MRTQDEFVAARQADWAQLDAILATKPELHQLRAETISEAGALYRSICADLMRARAAGYSMELMTYLDALAGRAHSRFYGVRPLRLRGAWDLVAREFPRALRRGWKFFALSCLLFGGPLLVSLFATIAEPTLATSILPRGMLEGAAASYAEGVQGRESEADAMMAGFYVYNNVGIAFRCFATGILFGLGSMFFLFYNGLVIGCVLGYVIQAGHGEHILTFVCGHGAFELTAICIAGGAGLQLGYSLVETKGKTRLGSLRSQAVDIGKVVIGAAMMLVIAAAIEGFWSPSAVSPQIKWTVGATLWVLVAVYLAAAGRGRRASTEEHRQ